MGMIKRMQIDVMEDLMHHGPSKRMALFKRNETTMAWHSFKLIISMLAAQGMIETTEDGDIDLTHEGHKRIHPFVQL